MTSGAAAHRQLVTSMILFSMLGMPWSLSLQRMRRATKENKSTNTEKLGDSVKVYEPPSQPLGSLILLMGMGAHTSWTLAQWWFLDPAWRPSDQEWCKGAKNGAKDQDCTFGEEDKAAVQRLRSHLRIVDAVGTNTCSIGSAWYNYNYSAGSWPDAPPFAHELDQAVAIVFDLIERERKIVGSYDRIAIAGMSQGGDLALEVGIRFPHRLGMVMSERGMLPLLHSRMQRNQHRAASPGTSFILTAVDKDDATTPLNVKASCDSLLRGQTQASFKLYHGVVHHGSFSKAEWELSIKAFTLMLNSGPKAPQIALLTQWDLCGLR